MKIYDTNFINPLFQNNFKTQGKEQKLQSTNINMKIKTEGNVKQLNSLDIELYAINNPYSESGIKDLLQKSPIGLGAEPSKEDIENMGYSFKSTAFHIGAPVTYQSKDGGTITVYNGKGPSNAGEDQRKIVYKKGNLVQTMYYDDNGKLTSGSISVKSLTTSTDIWVGFSVKNNNITRTITHS